MASLKGLLSMVPFASGPRRLGGGYGRGNLNVNPANAPMVEPPRFFGNNLQQPSKDSWDTRLMRGLSSPAFAMGTGLLQAKDQGSFQQGLLSGLRGLNSQTQLNSREALKQQERQLQQQSISASQQAAQRAAEAQKAMQPIIGLPGGELSTDNSGMGPPTGPTGLMATDPNRAAALSTIMQTNPSLAAQTYLQNQVAQQQIQAKTATDAAKTLADMLPSMSEISGLRKEAQKQFAPLREAASSAAQLDALLSKPGPISDLAARIKFAKVLDPGSVVRESEIAMQVAASGPWNRLESYIRKAEGAGDLTPLERQDMRRALGELMSVYEKAGSQAVDYWQGEAQASNIPYARISGPALDFPQLIPPQAPAGNAAQTGAPVARPAWATEENRID